MNENLLNFLLHSLRIFANLIIEEAANPSSPDLPFLQVDIAPIMPRRSDNRGNNTYLKVSTILNQVT